MLSMKLVLSVACAIPCLTAIWFYGYAILGARDLFSNSRTPATPDFQPSLTVLKPLCGLDHGAYQNLASFCRQDYPAYQILFGVRDHDDPSVAVVRQLIRDFPQRDIRLVVNDRMIGASPKVSNLANMEAEAKYPLLLISDGDIRVEEDYLRRVVQPLRDPTVGAVTCMHRSLGKGAAATIEALRISTDFCAGLLVARKLEGVKFALGSTTLVTRAALERIGGFSAFADYLADDFMLGHLVGRAGYSVVLSDYVVEHALTTRSLLDLVRREIRWNRGMRVSRPWGYLGLLFTQGVPMSLCLWLVTARSALGWVIVALTWGMRLVMGHIVGFRYLKDRAARKYLWLVPVADLIGFAPWCYSFIGNTVDWRGQRFRLTPAGKLIPIAVTASVVRRWSVPRVPEWMKPRLAARRWAPLTPVLLTSVLAAILVMRPPVDPSTLVVSPSPPLLYETNGGTTIVRIAAALNVSCPPPNGPARTTFFKRATPIFNGLRNHVEVLSGLSSFWALALTDGAFEKDEDRATHQHEFGQAGRTALFVAWGFWLWKQWRPGTGVVSWPQKHVWQFQMVPTLDDDRRLSVVATLRRRF